MEKMMENINAIVVAAFFGLAKPFQSLNDLDACSMGQLQEKLEHLVQARSTPRPTVLLGDLNQT